ncbi:hypothetical protein TEU_03870 [Thermococcus eurythermalis]|uniref:Glycosyltransferase 2-like domain-containing protein n=2 Tax=Thermococcus eurythermalis TaxID=1505907 RepID=A0A097QSW0_9EURY|nr:hypothetical protein TEU_03870 [Thermococcus eurythermalis]
MSLDLDDILVVIRSTGERTEKLCEYAVLQNGIDKENIIYVKNISPFSKALEEGYKLALEYGKKYTFFIDADMIILPNTLGVMVEAMERLPNKIFFMNPLAYDYLSGLIIRNGPRLYRTSHLQVAIKLIQDESVSLRPETFVVKRMRRLGYLSIDFDYPSALHEFEQYRRDIFRRVITRYFKSSSTTRKYLESRFEKLRKTNLDFEVAYLAIEYARKNKVKKPKLSYDQYQEIFKELNIEEKKEINNLELTYRELLEFIKDNKDKFIYYKEMYSGLSNLLNAILNKIREDLKSAVKL